LHRISPETTRTGFALAADNAPLFCETDSQGKSRILRIVHGAATTVVAPGSSIDFVAARPGRPELLYRCGGAVWLAGLDGSANRQLKLEPGKTGETVWTQSGRTLLYLHIPDNSRQLITLREHDPADGSDRLLASTTQFESVAPNTDSSVFVGASRSRASAYVLLLLRVTKRELTLCEHHASDPGMVSPIFSPDSQSVFFVSDRHGKQALYRVRVEKFVEETEG
jgi:oligogalacturonide lyase